MSSTAEPVPERTRRTFTRRDLLVTAVATMVTALGADIAVKEAFPLFVSALSPRLPPRRYPPYRGEAAAGWSKFAGNPVMGASLGSCFDVCVLHDGLRFRMWFSWRTRGAIGLTESHDGLNWTPPREVLAPSPRSNWESVVNRPVVLKRHDGYAMWYTGQTDGTSSIGYATSLDGVHWRRMSHTPVLRPEHDWEKVAVMAPCVLWDTDRAMYRMWYSGGDQYEPNAIGYAESSDGISWRRYGSGPVFTPSGGDAWDRARVAACQVIPWNGSYLMFYIGFFNESSAEIGLARSHDGINNWERSPQNPILRPADRATAWDYDAIYRPWVLDTPRGWILWYNGRRGTSEQIGVAMHPGPDLWG